MSRGNPTLFAPAFALVLLAGCATPAAELDAASVVDEAGSLFSAPLEMEQPSFGAEPNIAVLPDGTIFITAVAGSQEKPNANEGAAWLWRSTDGGDTWETLRAPARDTPLGTVPGTRRPFGSSDADVVTSPDGHVYSSDWWNWGSPVILPTQDVNVNNRIVSAPNPNARYGSYMVEHSSDGGDTWTSTPVTTLDSFGGIDRQWLVAGPDGWVGLFYAYFHGANPSRPTEAPDAGAGYASIQAVYSTDHGETWSDPTPVVGPSSEGFSQIAHPRLRDDGLLWMPHGYTANVPDGTYWRDPSEVRVALSNDMGATWTDVKVADVPEGFDNLWAVQGDHTDDGVLHVAWAARVAGNDTLQAVYHSESADDGVTWSEPVMVSAPGISFLPWVATRGTEVAISYYGADAWGEPTELPEDVAWFPIVARRAAAGEAWTRANVTTDPVKTGPMCPRGAACPGERELLDYFGLEFDASGSLHVSFARSRELDGAESGLVSYARSLTG